MTIKQAPRNFSLDIEKLETLARGYRDSYRTATPFPHAVIDDFLPVDDCEALLDVFPSVDSKVWLDWRKRDTNHQPRKLGIGNASRLTNVSPYLLNVLNSFNSYPFLNFLGILTGIPWLISDPYLRGGGIHQILPGGKLDIHTDFNHHKDLNIYRRINVLFYLNKDWQPHYNGQLELWQKEPLQKIEAISPVFNRLVIFNTNKESLHGHPKPLNTPDGITRKSLALYYYTAYPPDEQVDSHTDWYETTNLIST